MLFYPVSPTPTSIFTAQRHAHTLRINRQKTRHRKLCLTDLPEPNNIKQQSHHTHRICAIEPKLLCTSCFNKCLLLYRFYFLHPCAFYLKMEEELLMLFSSKCSVVHSNTVKVCCVTQIHTHIDWPIDPLTPFEGRVNGYFSACW